ncbi:MAG TPA: hypothetical protein VFJ16_05955 [Longimicrobium sp.]|nr:hypothetical protein [Longimicrobium sp.]
MTPDPAEAPAWLSALAPLVERADLRIPLKTPIHLPTGRIVSDVAGVFMRLPRWTGARFVDDFAKKAAGMVELDGEHLFAELAVLRLLEKDGWTGRWVNTWSGKGEVWKYLTEWRDVPRQEQRNRVLEDPEPRQLLARVATMNRPARYAGCWDVFAWRGNEFAFFQCKKGSAKPGSLSTDQEDWLRSALYVGDERLTVPSFCVVQWDYAQTP